MRAARFEREATALRVYQRAQDAILRTTCDVSVYRILLNQIAHVIALGTEPPAALKGRLERLLATGEPATLPPEVLDALRARRRQATRLGPWVEFHHRPGTRL